MHTRHTIKPKPQSDTEEFKTQAELISARFEGHIRRLCAFIKC